MYFGPVALDGSVDLWCLVRPSTGVPTAPDAAPTFSIYEGGSDTPQTSGSDVSMTGPVDSKTGWYRKSHSVTASTGYERGKTYVVKFSFAISATTYGTLGTFTVV